MYNYFFRSREKRFRCRSTYKTSLQSCVICKQLKNRGVTRLIPVSYGSLITSHNNTSALVQRFGRIDAYSSFGGLLAAWLVCFCQILLAKFKWASDVAVVKAACLVGRKQPASGKQWRWLHPAFKTLKRG